MRRIPEILRRPPDFPEDILPIAPFIRHEETHHEVRVGSGDLSRTDYVINPRYRPALEDLLYR